jgi:hypothetical protein
MRRLVAALTALFLLPAPTFGAELNSEVAGFFERLSMSVPDTGRVVFCHGFNCAFRTEIGLSRADHARMASLMSAGRGSPDAERKAIARTEVWFEKRVAPLTGTGKAKARSGGLTVGGDRTQFDCIDATVNTFSLLIVLDRLGLLRHHTVAPPISRLITGGGPHFTATIADKKGGQGWTVDPWTHDHGELPDVWPVERWKAGG